MSEETKTIKVRCGYCPRIVFKKDEPDGEFKKMDGKIICPVCRIMKKSNHREEIQKDGEIYKKEKEKKEEESRKEALVETTDIAMASQDRAGRKYKRK